MAVNTIRILLLLVCCLSFAVLAQEPALTRPEVEVKGLSKDSVFVKINGSLAHIKVGSKKDNIRLQRIDGRGAWFTWQDQQFYRRLNKTSGAKYQEPKKKTARFSQGYGGHYKIPGRINGMAVKFLVDTGATNVAMNVVTAKRLGLNYRNGQQGWANTANGRIPIFRVKLNSVSVGGIEIKNVQGSVSLDESDSEILLGNSYLQKLNMTQESGLLILSEK